MGFFKDLFSDIKNQGTPIGKYQDTVVKYVNFSTLQSYAKSGLSDEVGFEKASILLKEIKELSNNLPSQAELKVYHQNGDLETTVQKSIVASQYIYDKLLEENLIDYKLLKFAFTKVTDSNNIAVFPMKHNAGKFFNAFINSVCKDTSLTGPDEIFLRFLERQTIRNAQLMTPYAKKAVSFYTQEEFFNTPEYILFQKEMEYYDYSLTHTSSSEDNYLDIYNACISLPFLQKNESESKKGLHVYDLSVNFLSSQVIYKIKEMKIICHQSLKGFDINLSVKLH
ncbi:MAG: hypothetical protein WKF85_01305 [Chitinophagaceae bacterium]